MSCIKPFIIQNLTSLSSSPRNKADKCVSQIVSKFYKVDTKLNELKFSARIHINQCGHSSSSGGSSPSPHPSQCCGGETSKSPSVRICKHDLLFSLG